MRDQWYADKNDIVKWGAVFHWVGRCSQPPHVLYVPMLTPDPGTPSLVLASGTSAPVDAGVYRYFRNLRGIALLPWPTGVTLQIVENPFTQAGRATYFDAVKQMLLISKRLHSPTLVVIDPDDGVEPQKSPGQTHVLDAELHDIYQSMSPGDWLVVYQHIHGASNKANRTMGAKSRISAALAAPAVEVITGSVSQEVVMLGVQKP